MLLALDRPYHRRRPFTFHNQELLAELMTPTLSIDKITREVGAAPWRTHRTTLTFQLGLSLLKLRLGENGDLLRSYIGKLLIIDRRPRFRALWAPIWTLAVARAAAFLLLLLYSLQLWGWSWEEADFIHDLTLEDISFKGDRKSLLSRLLLVYALLCALF